MASNILFIRHAQSYGNVSGMIGYTHENDRLTPYGIEQSEQLGGDLRRIIERTKLPTFIYVSEANRTRETAFHSGVINLGTEFIVDPRLNEIAMGSLTNIAVEQRRVLFERVLSGQMDSFPSGEGTHHVKRRGNHFLSSRSPNALHLIFTHGIWIELMTGRKKPENASITHYQN